MQTHRLRHALSIIFIKQISFSSFMKPIPKINLNTHYESEFSSAELQFYNNMPGLIKMIETEDNPVNFKNQLLSIAQLYFDDLVDNDVSGNTDWPEQSEALSKLNLAGKKAIGSFYRGEGIDFDGVKETLLPYASVFQKYAKNEKQSKARHLFYKSDYVQRFGLKLQQASNSMADIDTIVCVASGGFEPSYLAMDMLEKEDLGVMRFSYIERKDSKVRVPACTPYSCLDAQIRDKRVMVVEDWMASGRSWSYVMKFTSDFKPAELYGGSVIGGDIIAPWFIMKVFSSSDPFFCRKLEQ